MSEAETVTEWGVRWDGNGFWSPPTQGVFADSDVAADAARRFAAGLHPGYHAVVVSRTVTRTKWRTVDSESSEDRRADVYPVSTSELVERVRAAIESHIEIAQKADSIVYVILCADRGFYGGGYYGDREMRKLTEETGGRVIDVGNHPEKLKDAFAQLANELRNQYMIGYTPTNEAKDGSFRKVEIRVPKIKDAKIQARKGYYAPRD